MSYATSYECRGYEFFGPRRLELEIAYQEKLLEPRQSELSRRQWYDANIWWPHRAEIRNPFSGAVR